MKDEKSYYAPKDFFVGAALTVNSQVFEIVEADEYTLRYMESNSYRKFPQSSIDFIVQKMLRNKEAIGRAVIKFDQGDGALTTAQVRFVSRMQVTSSIKFSRSRESRRCMIVSMSRSISSGELTTARSLDASRPFFFLFEFLSFTAMA